MATIPVKLNDLNLEKIDVLIKRGLYKNRSHAIRTMIEEKLNEANILIETQNIIDETHQNEIVQKLLKLRKVSFELKTKLNAAEIIGEDRERL